MTKIIIIGCGWLGKPLAVELFKEGHHVTGTTTHSEKLDELSQQGVEAHLLNLLDSNVEEQLNAISTAYDYIFINIPPTQLIKKGIDYAAEIEKIVKRLHQNTTRGVIFVSSTSVYPNTGNEVVETTVGEPSKPSGGVLLDTENRLMEWNKSKVVVLRIAGLIGYDRLPSSFLRRMNKVKDLDAPLNLIHRDDCIGIIKRIVKDDIFGEIFNLVCDYHPTRREFYRLPSDQEGLYSENMENREGNNQLMKPGRTFKIVSNKKIKQAINYEFKYPNPLEIDD
ncbi:MAG: NAD(P)-binding domain-containing protein [Bacteroidales bacterium]|nr:NAD(P)-binding domain-containing protein [Bacteroidales bacterium]